MNNRLLFHLHPRMVILLLLAALLLIGCTMNQKSQTTSSPSTNQPALPPLLETGKVPTFDHIIIIILENQNYSAVIGSSQMPYLNTMAKANVLLTQYHAVSHPSLPNYIALIGGDTFNITSNCTNCTVDHTSLPDLIEKSGRTWKTYQEDIPSPCFVGNSGNYVQKHDPFVYFLPIRNDAARCQRSVVSLDQLNTDLNSNTFPNFAFITPNMCHSGHNCPLSEVDNWLKTIVPPLEKSPSVGEKTLIAIIFDEGEGNNDNACCGLPSTGGRVAAVLISPLAKTAFEDNTPLSHYSLLKTILRAWKLPDLGQTINPAVSPILAPWK
jgi:phosphatidylinositol-3-phosphatase